MTLLFAAFERTGTEPVQALCLREAQQRVLSDKVWRCCSQLLIAPSPLNISCTFFKAFTSIAASSGVTGALSRTGKSVDLRKAPARAPGREQQNLQLKISVFAFALSHL